MLCNKAGGLEKGRYSSIGRATVCGTVSSLFESGYPPIKVNQFLFYNKNSLLKWTI
jgi:hypothetical protein